jgi:hypothetical protein
VLDDAINAASASLDVSDFTGERLLPLINRYLKTTLVTTRWQH